MSSRLGIAKLFFTKRDFGKMLKLKDIENLVITNVDSDNVKAEVTITIATPIDNSTNNRVKAEKNSNYVDRQNVPIGDCYTFEDENYGDKGLLDSENIPDDYITIKNGYGEKVGRIRKGDIKFYKSVL